MQNKTKAQTFVGFAVKANKFRSGANTLATVKKAFLILVCRSASGNTKKIAEKYAKKYGCPLLITEGTDLSELACKQGIKIAAVTDRSLANAIVLNAAPVFKIFNSES